MRLEVGDCVALKTGGYLMTVYNVVNSDNVQTQWFDTKGELQSGVFPVDALNVWDRRTQKA